MLPHASHWVGSKPKIPTGRNGEAPWQVHTHESKGEELKGPRAYARQPGCGDFSTSTWSEAAVFTSECKADISSATIHQSFRQFGVQAPPGRP